MQTINPDTLTGTTVSGQDGEKLGKVEEIYFDNETGKPEWAGVKTGMFGGHISLVPLAAARQDDNGLQVPYDKAQLKDSPHHDPGTELSQDDEAELFRHYGVAYGGETVTAQPNDQAPRSGERRDRAGEDGMVGRDTSGPTTDDAMTRSEERMRVGTQSREAGKARLRKYVVTENVSQTVPVSHEKVRVEREPITDANRGQATAGPDISEETHEVTLNEERAVVGKETVPVERVRMTKETVSGEETVSGDVRKEQIVEESGQGTETSRGQRR